MHNLAYVRTLLAPGSGEVQAGNVAKARSLFTESVEAAVKVISYTYDLSIALVMPRAGGCLTTKNPP